VAFYPQTPIQVTHTGYPYRLRIHPYRLPIQVPKHVWVRYPYTHAGHPGTIMPTRPLLFSFFFKNIGYGIVRLSDKKGPSSSSRRWRPVCGTRPRGPHVRDHGRQQMKARTWGRHGALHCVQRALPTPAPYRYMMSRCYSIFIVIISLFSICLSAMRQSVGVACDVFRTSPPLVFASLWGLLKKRSFYFLLPCSLAALPNCVSPHNKDRPPSPPSLHLPPTSSDFLLPQPHLSSPSPHHPEGKNRHCAGSREEEGRA
jgi:hypothetical protein